MSKLVGVSVGAAASLVDLEDFCDTDNLAPLDLDPCKEIGNAVQKPGGGAAEHTTTKKVRYNLVAASFLCRLCERCQCMKSVIKIYPGNDAMGCAKSQMSGFRFEKLSETH
jgi:hypothetical protein